MIAAGRGITGMLAYLLAETKNDDAQDILGDSALHKALKHPENVKLQLESVSNILKMKKNVNQENASGLTPLDIVVRKMGEIFHSNRNDDDTSCTVEQNETLLENYRSLVESQNSQRVLVTLEKVNQFVESVLKTVGGGQKEEPKAVKEVGAQGEEDAEEEPEEDSDAEEDATLDSLHGPEPSQPSFAELEETKGRKYGRGKYGGKKPRGRKY